jgi:hypothetical protein
MAASLHRAPLYSTFLHRHQPKHGFHADWRDKIAGQRRWCEVEDVGRPRVPAADGEKSGNLLGLMWQTGRM